jgi:hypothetical protein
MSVDKVEAFKISDNHCFLDKQTAYKEEILTQYRALPKTEGRKSNPSHFAKFAQEVATWLRGAEAFVAQMNGEDDPDMKRKLASQE